MRQKLEYINKSIPSILLFAAILISCSSNDEKVTGPEPGDENIFFGESAAMGDGEVTTWIQLDENNQPLSVGISFDEEALNNLPHENFELELELPEEYSGTAFTHVSIDWNHMGHDPSGIYGLPHFDFHFYMVDKSTRNSILAGPDPIEVDTTEIPPYYFSTVDAVPRMGVHYIDATSAELNGATFTETFIYGYYFGNMIFLEPMITIDYLKTKPEMTKTLKIPQVYPIEGVSYPKSYSIIYDDEEKVYSIVLSNFIEY